MPFYRIYKGGDYLFIILKEKKKYDFKFVMWIFNIYKDNEVNKVKFNSNKINNMFDIEKNEGLKDFYKI